METQEQTVVTLTAEQANEMRNECNKHIDLYNSLNKLYTNRDFKKVFLDEYVDKEPARLVHLLGEPSFNMSKDKENYRADIKERMIGIARFSEYMRNVGKMADQARKTLDDIEKAL